MTFSKKKGGNGYAFTAEGYSVAADAGLSSGSARNADLEASIDLSVYPSCIRMVSGVLLLPDVRSFARVQGLQIFQGHIGQRVGRFEMVQKIHGGSVVLAGRDEHAEDQRNEAALYVPGSRNSRADDELAEAAAVQARNSDDLLYAAFRIVGRRGGDDAKDLFAVRRNGQ